jgi:purine-nucleoside phosphorylase
MTTSVVEARLQDTVRFIRDSSKVGARKPLLGVVLGSGLGPFADTMRDLEKVPYASIPNFARSAVEGHAGNLCFGRVGDVEAVCMQGRVHLYEGHPVDAVVHGARTMALLGVKAVLVTNAAGGLDPSWSPGDLMLVLDHLNMTGTSPLVGPNIAAFGPRFPDMSNAYDAKLCDALRTVSARAKIPIREGVYAGLLGPSYETPAEVRMVRALGAQAVGMSTVLEVIALRHMGVRVGALSCITNLAAGISKAPLDHKEVEETARARRTELATLLGGWIEESGALLRSEGVA